MIPDAVSKYINAIRNKNKADYAKRYARFLWYSRDMTQEPDRGELSYMAAQAVRMNLNTLFEGGSL